METEQTEHSDLLSGSNTLWIVVNILRLQVELLLVFAHVFPPSAAPMCSFVLSTVCWSTCPELHIQYIHYITLSLCPRPTQAGGP